MAGFGYSEQDGRVRAWQTAMPLLVAMHGEFRELSKRKPQDPVSKQKILLVNRLLGKCREILTREESRQFLDLLDEDAIPQNSDAALVISQYVAAMEQFRSMYYDGFRWSVPP